MARSFCCLTTWASTTGSSNSPKSISMRPATWGIWMGTKFGEVRRTLAIKRFKISTVENVKPVYAKLCLAICLVLNLALLINLLIPVFTTFGIFVMPAFCGNTITEPLEFLMNKMVPITLALHAAGVVICKRHHYRRIMKGMIWSSGFLLLITIMGLVFGYWFFSVALEGTLNFSSRIWWLSFLPDPPRRARG
jgi:hypothetical protein